MMMASSKVGNANSTSWLRLRMVSIQPPKYPATTPITTPAARAMATDSMATATAMPEPEITRLSVSRPSSSVPNRCRADGPVSVAAKSLVLAS